MNREELLEKLKAEGPISKEDLFAYFNVKNVEGLEVVLYDKSKEAKVNMEYINSSFVILYQLRKKEFYNPVEERFYFFSLILPGLYGFLPEEVNLLGRSLGVFEAIMFLDSVFEEKAEIKYYEKMYQNFINNKNDLSIFLERQVDTVYEFLSEKMKDLKMEDLEKLGKNIMGELNNFTNKNKPS
jgi:hypothetical protein